MLEIGKLLYSNKKQINCITTANKKVGNLGPAGCISKAHKGTSSPKMSVIGLFLDEIFMNKTVAALEGPAAVYTELNKDGVIYKSVFDGKEIDWEKEIPEYPYNLLPLFIYTLKTDNLFDVPYPEEIKELFKESVDQFDSLSSLTLANVTIMCDSFYYNYVENNLFAGLKENAESLSIDSVKKSYISGLMKELDLFKPLDVPELELTKDLNQEKGKMEGSENVEDVFQQCIDGKKVISYDWNETQTIRIPQLSTLSDYVPDKVFYSALNKIEHRLSKVLLRLDSGKTGLDAIGNDYLNFFVAGKPGTGKTTMAYALGAATGMPTYTIAASKHTEEDTFEGMNKVINGNLSFVTTDFLDAYTNGGIIVIEEINLADPAVIMGALGQAIEFPFILKRDGYEPVRRHPMCVIIGTMNIGTYGSKGINQALSSRFKQTYILDDPSETQFIQILESQGYTKKASKYVYNAYKKINEYLASDDVNQEDICLNLSIRGCLGALQNFDDGDTIEEALINSLVGKIYEIEPTLAKDVIKNVIKTLPNYR